MTELAINVTEVSIFKHNFNLFGVEFSQDSEKLLSSKELLQNFLSRVESISFSMKLKATGKERYFEVFSCNSEDYLELWFSFDESLIDGSGLLKDSFRLDGYNAKKFLASVLQDQYGLVF